MAYLTLANQLTILRVALTPFFVLAVVYGYLGTGAPGVPDCRRYRCAGWPGRPPDGPAHQPGRGGSIPLADKLLLVATFIVLTLPTIPLVNHLPLWLTVLMISRDIVIVGVVAVVNLAVGPKTFRPSPLGQVDDGLLLHPDHHRRDLLQLPGADVDAGGRGRVQMSLGLTLLSAADYAFRMRRLIGDPGGVVRLLSCEEESR